MTQRYEYGVVHRSGRKDQPHRDGFTKEKAINWIKSFDRETEKSGRWLLVRREIGDWEEVSDDGR